MRGVSCPRSFLRHQIPVPSIGTGKRRDEVFTPVATHRSSSPVAKLTTVGGVPADRQVSQRQCEITVYLCEQTRQ